MAEYVLFTESTADLTAELVQQLGVEVLPMLFSLDGKEYNNYPDNRELDPHDFYDALRAGGMSTTSQINQATFEDAFTPVLEAGKDIKSKHTRNTEHDHGTGADMNTLLA